MGKIFLIGDTHIALGYPNKVDKWHKVHEQYFRDFLIPTLKEKATPDDIIIHLGDLFDNRNIIPINLMNFALDVVEEMSRICPLHIIVGNHDSWAKSASEINTIRPFKYIPNVFIYDKTTKIEHQGVNLLMMPYIHHKKEQIDEILNNKDCEYLFCHSDLNGCRMHLTSVAHKNLNKIDVKDFSSFKKVYSGHIHIVQRNKNFTFVGSNFQMDRNDMGDQKGIFVLDLEDGIEEFIPNNISPVFKKIYVKTESDVTRLSEIDDTDYIDILISNSLLMENRKIRRKLEVILEQKKFETIDYIDDIVEKVDESKNEDDIVLEEDENGKIDISISLDYEDYIKEYINKQKFNSEEFRKGIIEEYDKIVDVYKEEFKDKV